MTDSEIFISSCSRRELAHRRPTRATIRIEFVILLLVLLAVGAVLAVRGWF
ncbi:MAG: hypothetical protein ACR2OB_13800 [Solirubrobacteraceae bacterium]